MTDLSSQHTLLIACYHYFREESYPGGIYPVNLKSMSRQIEAIGRDYTFIGQSDVLKWIREGVPNGKYCLITFDDGLKEQMNAFRFLKERNIPSIYYVPSGHYKAREVLEVHKLHFVRTKMSDEVIASELNNLESWKSAEFDDDALAAQYPFDSPESRRVKYFINFILSSRQKAELTDMLFSGLVSDEQDFFESLYMSEEEIKELAASDALGAHGKSHTPLSRFNGAELAEEISHSTRFLQNITQKPVKSFAYPYGGKTAVKEDTHTGFDQTEVEFALTTWHGVNNATDYIDKRRFYMKRVDTNYVPGGKNDRGEF